MNLRELDTDMLRDIREMKLKDYRAVQKELDRRMDEKQSVPEIKFLPLSRLASKEGVTPDCIRKRCKRHDITLVDKEGNPNGPGKTAYVNLQKYFNRK